MPSFCKVCKKTCLPWEKDRSYFRFPKNLTEEWNIALGFPKDTIHARTTQVCSDHFDKNDILIIGKRRCLKKNAIPISKDSVCQNSPVSQQVQEVEEHNVLPNAERFDEPSQPSMSACFDGSIALILVNQQPISKNRLSIVQPSIRSIPNHQEDVKTSFINETIDVDSSYDQRIPSIVNSNAVLTSTKEERKPQRRVCLKREDFASDKLWKYHQRLYWTQNLKIVKLQRALMKSREQTRLLKKKQINFNKEVDKAVALASLDLPAVLRDLVNRNRNQKLPYSSVLRDFAIKVRSHSTACFEYIRTTFGNLLPCSRRVSIWLKKGDDIQPDEVQSAIIKVEMECE